jgi:hypothetical protein
MNRILASRPQVCLPLAASALLSCLVAPVGFAIWPEESQSSAAKAAGGDRGTARFRVPSRGTKRPPAAHVRFWLPPGYRQLVGGAGGNPVIGSYRQPFKRSDGSTCSVQLESSGQARSAPPKRRGDRLQHRRGDKPESGTYVKVQKAGRVGSLRWYVGPSATPNPVTGEAELVGIAVRAAPRRFVPAKSNWAVVTITISGWQACGPGRGETARTLGRAIRSVRIVAGRPHAVPGVPTTDA